MKSAKALPKYGSGRKDRRTYGQRQNNIPPPMAGDKKRAELKHNVPGRSVEDIRGSRRIFALSTNSRRAHNKFYAPHTLTFQSQRGKRKSSTVQQTQHPSNVRFVYMDCI
ncbi:hypothetical protein DPMN_117235 [Dreissena polymorpha]|uniref:Uncharacterized protein n=1 Tax=Dreissena polymorpha TaxID=45954 RepID=A0A9D4QU41_DREPO|nr:hypothetical protein DPMN_117235 [Dreissena polymorpha]